MTQYDRYFYKIEKNTLKIVAKVVLRTEKIARVSILTRDRAAVEALLKTVNRFVDCERELFDAEDEKLAFGAIFYSSDIEEKRAILDCYREFLRDIVDENI